jgi:integrase
MLEAIPEMTLRDLRDRALIATLTYSFARISAALKMKVEDLRARGAGWAIRLHEKGGKPHTMPCHHALAAGIAEDRKGWLFHTARGHDGKVLSENLMTQPDAWRTIRRRGAAAGIAEADRLSQLPRNRDHRLSLQRWRARAASAIAYR